MFLDTDSNKIKWKRLFIATVIVCAIIIAGILWFDAPLYMAIRHADWNGWQIIGRIFSGYVWIATGAIFLGAFYVKKCITTPPRIRNNQNRISPIVFINDVLQKIRGSYVFYIFCSCLGAGIVAKVIKTVVGRFRPVFFEALDLTGFHPLSTEWAFNSMPSGHTTVSFAGLVMIGLLAPRYKWLTWGLAVIIGFSRVAAGFHWPTDVILGAFIGMVAADITRATFAKINA
ncbi:MAG: phosphatase PAP2 family protein [Alphaproteobacteria bacterium]|nr:phosphatase PAP2 family protein [Alphaproteobacteria bacterium]